MPVLLTKSQVLCIILVIVILAVLSVYIIDILLIKLFSNKLSNVIYLIMQLTIYLPFLVLVFSLLTHYAVTSTSYTTHASLYDKQNGHVPPSILRAWETANIPEYINTLPLHKTSLKKAKITQIDSVENSFSISLIVPTSKNSKKDHSFTVKLDDMTIRDFKKSKSTSYIYYKIIPETVTATYKKGHIVGLKLYIET